MIEGLILLTLFGVVFATLWNVYNPCIDSSILFAVLGTVLSLPPLLRGMNEVLPWHPGYSLLVLVVLIIFWAAMTTLLIDGLYRWLYNKDRFKFNDKLGYVFAYFGVNIVTAYAGHYAISVYPNFHWFGLVLIMGVVYLIMIVIELFMIIISEPYLTD